MDRDTNPEADTPSRQSLPDSSQQGLFELARLFDLCAAVHLPSSAWRALLCRRCCSSAIRSTPMMLAGRGSATSIGSHPSKPSMPTSSPTLVVARPRWPTLGGMVVLR